jgi:hypothetical protein
MATKIEKPLKREIEIGGQAFIVTLTPQALTLVGKGRRKGIEIRWDEMVSGEAALARALQASIVDPSVRLEPSAQNVREGSKPRPAGPSRQPTRRSKSKSAK